MPEKLKTYDHFSGLREAGGLSFFDSNKKYDVVNAGEGILDGINDEPIRKLTEEEEDQFIYHIKEDEEGNPLKQEPKSEEEYTSSEKYEKYIEHRNSLIEKGMERLASTMQSEDGSPLPENGATIKASPMPEKIDTTTQKDSNPVPQLEQQLINTEDKKLIASIHDQAEFWKEILNKKSGDKKKDERNNRELKEFTHSPYMWMKGALTNTINKQEKELLLEQNQQAHENLKRRLEKNRIALNMLNEVFKKNLPLNLDRKFDKNEIDLGNGKIFNVEALKERLYTYTKSPHSKYEITNVIQRKHGDFIVLKTENGEVELDIDDAMGMLKEKENEAVLNKEKQEKFDRIKDGDIVRTRIGGKHAEITSYKTFHPKNGEIFFLSLGKTVKVQLSLEKMKDILFDYGTEFIVEEDKKKKKVTTSVKAVSAIPDIRVQPVYVQAPPNFPEPIKLVDSKNENDAEKNTELLIKDIERRRAIELDLKSNSTITGLIDGRILSVALGDIDEGIINPATISLYPGIISGKRRTIEEIKKWINDKYDAELALLKPSLNEQVVKTEEGPSAENIALFMEFLQKMEEDQKNIERIEKELEELKSIEKVAEVIEPKVEIKKQVIEILSQADLKKEVEKIIKGDFGKDLEKKGLQYKGLEIDNTVTGFHIVANFEGSFPKGSPKFSADIISDNGEIKIVNPVLDANKVVKLFAPSKNEIDAMVDNMGEKIKEYLEKSRNKKVGKIEIENSTLKITYK